MGVLILAEIAIGILMVVKTASHSLTELLGGNFELLSGIWHAIALVCDIIATVSLCTILRNSRTGFKNTNKTLNSLFRNFVGRGILLAILQMLFLVLWFTQYKTLNWQPLLYLLGKFYVSTLIALLNLRKRARTNSQHVGTSPSTVIRFNLPRRFGVRSGQTDTLQNESIPNSAGSQNSVHAQTNVETCSEIAGQECFIHETYKQDEALV